MNTWKNHKFIAIEVELLLLMSLGIVKGEQPKPLYDLVLSLRLNTVSKLCGYEHRIVSLRYTGFHRCFFVYVLFTRMRPS